MAFLTTSSIASVLLITRARETDAPVALDMALPQSPYDPYDTGPGLWVQPSGSTPTGGTSAPVTGVEAPAPTLDVSAPETTDAKPPCTVCTLAWLGIGAFLVFAILRARG